MGSTLVQRSGDSDAEFAMKPCLSLECTVLGTSVIVFNKQSYHDKYK